MPTARLIGAPTPTLAAAFKEIRAAGWQAVELFDHSLDWLGTPDHLRRLLAGCKRPRSLAGSKCRSAPNADHPHAPHGIRGTVRRGNVRAGGRRPASGCGRPRSTSTRTWRAAARRWPRTARGSASAWPIIRTPACTIETEAEIDILLNETQRTLLCLDASHIGLVGEDPVAHLRKYRGRTGYVHLKDWADGKFVEMGQGKLGLDFAAILAELEAQRFPGWVVVEQSRSDGSPAASAKTNART